MRIYHDPARISCDPTGVLRVGLRDPTPWACRLFACRFLSSLSTTLSNMNFISFWWPDLVPGGVSASKFVAELLAGPMWGGREGGPVRPGRSGESGCACVCAEAVLTAHLQDQFIIRSISVAGQFSAPVAGRSSHRPWV
jgi:hypothetical protein